MKRQNPSVGTPNAPNAEIANLLSFTFGDPAYAKIALLT
jgi:hypothetical protein